MDNKSSGYNVTDKPYKLSVILSTYNHIKHASQYVKGQYLLIRTTILKYLPFLRVIRYILLKHFLFLRVLKNVTLNSYKLLFHTRRLYPFLHVLKNVTLNSYKLLFHTRRLYYILYALFLNLKHRNNKYRLTIFVPCYNSDKTIRKTLDSILSQKTKFKFKILIADDASTDKTIDIIKQYQQKYPDTIYPIYRKENLGLVENHYDALINFIDTEYFCTLDSDDYYSNNNKLQLQVDALDQNYDCMFSSHCYYIILADGTKNLQLAKIPTGKHKRPYLVFHTSANLYRRSIFSFIKGKNKLLTVDVSLSFMGLHLGKCYFINKCMSNYIYNQQGTYSFVDDDTTYKMHVAQKTIILHYAKEGLDYWSTLPIDPVLAKNKKLIRNLDPHDYINKNT